MPSARFGSVASLASATPLPDIRLSAKKFPVEPAACTRMPYVPLSYETLSRMTLLRLLLNSVMPDAPFPNVMLSEIVAPSAAPAAARMPCPPTAPVVVWNPETVLSWTNDAGAAGQR